MLTIHLHDIELRGYHGLFPEEKILGNSFLIHLDIHVHSNARLDQIDQTVDYTKAYELIQATFLQPYELLETLAYDILKRIFSFDPKVAAAQITIIKKLAPIQHFQGNTGVTLAMERGDLNL